jgi:hypothetical protein
MAMMPHAGPAGLGTLIPETAQATPAAGQIQAKPRSMFRRGWEVFAENKLAIVGLGFVIFILLFCFVGPHIYVTPQVTVQTQDYLCHPSGAHLLGCDQLGYDIVGRLMVGGQNSLEVGLAAAFVACLFGSVYGAVSGFAGGVVDAFMMRIVDAVLSIPFIFVLIILAVLIRPSALTLMGFIALVYWPGPARLVRGETRGAAARDAECHRHDHRAGHLRGRRLDHLAVRPWFPWLRHRAAGNRLGLDAVQWPAVREPGLLVADLPGGPVHHRDRSVLQFHRRRAPRRLRDPAAEPVGECCPVWRLLLRGRAALCLHAA